MSATARPWRQPRVALTLLLVFVAGISAGMLIMALGGHQWLHQEAASASRDGKAGMVDKFKSELNLTPEQTQQFETVLDDYFSYYHSLQAQLDDVRAKGKYDMMRILNDDQKRKFERMMNEFQQQKRLR